MENQKPIIGILCIDTSTKIFEVYGSIVKSYVDAAYVNLIGRAGAQCIHICINKDEQYYRDVLGKINGVVLPGGAVFFDSAHILSNEQTNYCVRSAEIINRIAREMNERGVYFPVWGICLGYELLLYHSAGGRELRQDCTELKKSMALQLRSDYKSSKMFQNLPADLEEILPTEPFAYHFHRYCITEHDLLTFGIADQWRITATNKDDDGLEFISTCEHVRYPIYGLQFHPEKVNFEPNITENISRTENSIKCAQYFANFFISECGKNENKFASEDNVNERVLSRTSSTSTGFKPSEVYLFNENCELIMPSPIK